MLADFQVCASVLLNFLCSREVTKKNKGNRNQSYDGNLHILTFFSFTEHIQLINQMTDFRTVEIPNFGVFAIFVNLSNLSVGEGFPNQRVNVFQTDSLKVFTLQNNLSELRLTISSRNWTKIVTSNCFMDNCFIGPK